MKDEEKSQLGTKTIVEFFQQFGNDVYSIELLTILFDLLMTVPMNILLEGDNNEETLSISGEQVQEGNQTGDNPSEPANNFFQT